ncbi:Asp-tRNA(Asn)/Glu-tRNA(Gln) amidotransferase GatCAB subunit C [Pedobacter yulinensis]|uniref:Aspartyl/glutamyl-tRNA(Asn/Gln) amidotransferase subunit C n=1 Tax=Pedobacter yulinensis TaxID=2126353 RepID=A0A2T3HLM8_9SPHI|nr:Asp-tRNA(Asn)/Glu-tRNA(Gln) amidotransferase subunit GatC [Pedobacter yulinensis]PST83334.1 Asp-tRNA(Asn)/Glu-tRNA(Gln) amidotransferase GatCAB subunit C [Pedobacter yulinensis]
MNLDKERIYKIADLARIHIEDKDIDTLRADMNRILTFMEKLNELDTTHVEPLRYMNEQVNTWRADEVRNELSTEEGLMNAAEHNDRFFLVPKIIEK